MTVMEMCLQVDFYKGEDYVCEYKQYEKACPPGLGSFEQNV